MYYAIVSFGGSFPGRKVYRTEEEARAALAQAERDTACGGRLWCDPQVMARARIQAYRTRKAARAADISDTTDDSRRTADYIGPVVIRG